MVREITLIMITKASNISINRDAKRQTKHTGEAPKERKTIAGEKFNNVSFFYIYTSYSNIAREKVDRDVCPRVIASIDRTIPRDPSFRTQD